MGTIFDNILNQAGDQVIRFIGNLRNDVFTPSSFSFSNGEAAQSTENAEPSDIGQLALVGASGIGLASTAGIITVASHIHSQLKAMNNKVNLALGKLETIDKKIDQLLTITKRIDLKVSETHLREAIKHHLRSAINEDGVDLNSLAQLEGDLGNMFDGLEDGLLGNSSIRLSSDVRILLESICQLFSSSRIAFTTVYNNRHSSEPVPLLRVDFLDDIYCGKAFDDLSRSVVRFNSLVKKVHELRENSIQLITTRFSFCDDEDRSQLNGIFDEFFSQHFGLFGDGKENEIWHNSPSELFDGDTPEENICSFVKAWLWKTDAGLLRRLQLELSLFRFGYDGMFDDKIACNPDLKELIIQAPFRLGVTQS